MANNRAQYVANALMQIEVEGEKAKTSRLTTQVTFTNSKQTFSHQVTTVTPTYCLGKSATNKLCRQAKCIKNKCKQAAENTNGCSYGIKSLRTTKPTTTRTITGQVNCKCMSFSVSSSSYNQFLKSNSSNNSTKTFKATQQEGQQPQQLNYTHHICHYRHHHYRIPPAQKSYLSHLCIIKLCPQELVYLLYTLLLFVCSAYIPQHLIPLTEAACRYEPSRSCEAICRRIWTPPDNNNYDTNVLETNNVTMENLFAGDYNCTIRALVLMPDDDDYVASLKRVVPILQVAEQRIHATGLLPPLIQFDWMPQDDKCDAAFAVVKAMDGIVKNCSHVFFGPVCDYSLAAVGRIAKYFNSHGTPLISVGGSTFDFEKPKTKCTDEFYMLLRTGMLSFESISELTISIMKRNKWSRSIFFYDADGQRNVAGQHTCYLMMTSLGRQMRNENMTFAQYRITEKLKNRTQEMTREIGNKNSGKMH